MQIYIDDLLQVDVSEFKKYVDWSDDGKLIENKAGDQHYRFLAYISTLLPDGSTIFEIGTRWGASAAALSKNKNVHVVTCDIRDAIEDQKPSIKDIPNIEFIIGDGFDLIEKYKDSKIIFMDVDPHDGVQERKMIQKLIDVEFKGILLLDDIHLNKEMNDFWKSITQDKCDLTSIGHYSGTGIVFFGDEELTMLQTLRTKLN